MSIGEQSLTICPELASFPGCSCLQFLIASSMRKQRGKAWEIQSCAMTSGRQRVDRQGAVPGHCNSQTFALTSLESTEQWAVLMLSFERWSLKFFDQILQEGPWDSLLGTAPCLSIYHYVTVHVTKSPRPSPSVFAYCKNWRQKWPGNEAWPQVSSTTKTKLLC